MQARRHDVKFRKEAPVRSAGGEEQETGRAEAKEESWDQIRTLDPSLPRILSCWPFLSRGVQIRGILER